MNWDKAKSTLIVFFLLLNICLLVILVHVRASQSTLSQNTIRQTVSLLQEHRITVSEDSIQKKKYKNKNYHLEMLLFEKEKNLEKWLGKGYLLSENNPDEHRYVYSNQNKQLILNKTGMQFFVNKNAVLMQAQERKEIEADLAAKLKKLGFSEKKYYFSSAWFENGLYHAVIAPMAKNVKITGVELRVTADKEGIINLSGNWFEYSEEEGLAEDGILDVTAVLTNLVYLGDAEPMEISDISLAAYVSMGYLDNKIVTATPMYVFSFTNGREYHFDARSGEFIGQK